MRTDSDVVGRPPRGPFSPPPPSPPSPTRLRLLLQLPGAPSLAILRRDLCYLPLNLSKKTGMPSLAAARAANAALSSGQISIALFVGGTSGIGQALSSTIARYTGGNARIILCGRNRPAAEQTIHSYPQHPGNTHSFVESDLFQMKNVEKTTSSLLSTLPKLNILVLSTGFMDFRGRDETAEGIDKRLALNYYARWKFIYDLLPLLKRAKDAGEEARVMSILGPGSGWKADLDDLGLKRRYNPLKALTSAATYNDLMIEVSSQYLRALSACSLAIAVRASQSWNRGHRSCTRSPGSSVHHSWASSEK